MNHYPHLFEPIVLPNGAVVKNRTESTPSGLHFLQGPEPYPTEAVIANYIGRARNGAGIVVVTGCSRSSHPNPGHDQNWDLSDGHNQHYVAQLVEGIHAYGAKALHRGLDINEFLMDAASFDGENNGAFLGNNYDVSTGIASAYVVGDGSFPRYDGVECPKELMLDCADKLADFCLELKNNCGFDGIWIHGAYRHQFLGRCLSPITNQRTDEFGGTPEKRAAYPRLVFERIKQKCGRDFIIEMSVSGHDPEGGATIEEMCRTVQCLEGVLDIVQVKGTLIDESHPVQFHEPTPWLYMSEYYKKNLRGIAVMTVGGCFDPDANERILETGKADMIGMARAWISNLDYMELLREGRPEDITPCIRCNKCHRSSNKDPWTSVCSVNPLIGIEHRANYMTRPAGQPKHVAVIGGGPAGLKAAITACDRGHTVTIFEKSSQLGGQILVTEAVPFKWPLQNLRKWLIAQVDKRPIRVKLCCAPTPEELASEHFDVVLAATGASPAHPPIPGADGANVMTAVESYGRIADVRDTVAIIGGGEIGVETGIYLARMGRKVTVLEMRGMLAADSVPVHYWKMFRDEWESCETFTGVVNATVTGITESGVSYRDENGIERFVPAETVLLAAGMKPQRDAALAYAPCAGERFELIGDCSAVGNIQKVMRSAYIAASQF